MPGSLELPGWQPDSLIETGGLSSHSLRDCINKVENNRGRHQHLPVSSECEGMDAHVTHRSTHSPAPHTHYTHINNTYPTQRI